MTTAATSTQTNVRLHDELRPAPSGVLSRLSEKVGRSASRKLRVALAMPGVMRAAPSRLRAFARQSAKAERFQPTYPHWNLGALGI